MLHSNREKNPHGVEMPLSPREDLARHDGGASLRDRFYDGGQGGYVVLISTRLGYLPAGLFDRKSDAFDLAGHLAELSAEDLCPYVSEVCELLGREVPRVCGDESIHVVEFNKGGVPIAEAN